MGKVREWFFKDNVKDKPYLTEMKNRSNSNTIKHFIRRSYCSNMRHVNPCRKTTHPVNKFPNQLILKYVIALNTTL